MKYPQLVVYEADGRLAALLKPLAEARRWALREPRQPASCLRLLRAGGPGLLVLKLGRDLERELTLLDRARFLFPACSVLMVGEGDHARLEGYAYDLGAAYVLLPPPSAELLLEVVTGLMGAKEEA
jgi:hypothetical protein